MLQVGWVGSLIRPELGGILGRARLGTAGQTAAKVLDIWLNRLNCALGDDREDLAVLLGTLPNPLLSCSELSRFQLL